MAFGVAKVLADLIFPTLSEEFKYKKEIMAKVRLKRLREVKVGITTMSHITDPTAHWSAKAQHCSWQLLYPGEPR